VCGICGGERGQSACFVRGIFGGVRGQSFCFVCGIRYVVEWGSECLFCVWYKVGGGVGGQIVSFV